MPTPVPTPSRQSSRKRLSVFRRIETVTPLLAVPVVIYVIMTWTAGGNHQDGVPAISGMLGAPLLSIPMISGVKWTLSVGSALLFFALVLLSFEIVKATSSKSSAMVNHAASMAVLLFCLVMFLLIANFATATFFLLSMMALMDVLVGVIVSIVSARRDFGVGDGFAG
ncbi:hypothetical protein WNY37_15420 [Henriciella sp. AS95]|uniref:hypothetical protein n=1 Tax=Henriciella sp. AS95 TaxID=3135782 RepID=UPI003170C45F